VTQRQRANAAPTIPERLGRYQVLGHLATGGMAEILLARLEGPGGFQKVVVLKRVLPHLARKAEFRRMFVDEARIVASLRHPNIVQVQELGRDGDELFLVMEYLEGESVARLVRRVQSNGPSLDYAIAAHIIANACAGLHAAHEYVADGVPQHLVHRDVSPQNLFVTYDGAVKVLDFGVAKAVGRYTNTTTGQVKGKFAYMAPEQCLAEAVDRRTDVFALGILLWEATTGQRLFQRDNELLVFKAICEEPIRKPSHAVPDYPPVLENIVMRALERDRSQRYGSAAEMRRDLSLAIRDLSPAMMPEDDLASLMHQLFADRIAQKSDLLQKVGAGVNVGTLEWLELDTDAGVELSTNDLGTDLDAQSPMQSGTRASQRSKPPPGFLPAPKTSRTKPLLLGLGLAFALIFGLAIGTAVVIGTDDEAEAPAPRVARVPDAPPSIGELPRDALAPPTITTVTLDIESTPPGARVLVDGTERGVTPLALALPHSERAIEVTLALDGYRDVVEQITPDVNQRVRLSLVRGPAGRRPPRGRPQNPENPGPEKQRPGFYRFD
jgi:eukaryotic-like serine/threonine-protein kinase